MGLADGASHKLLRFEETLQMPHLPESSDEQNDSLCNGPPEDSLIRTFTRLTKPLLSVLKNKVMTLKYTLVRNICKVFFDHSSTSFVDRNLCDYSLVDQF